MRTCIRLVPLCLLVAVAASQAGDETPAKGNLTLVGEVVAVDATGQRFTVNCYRFITPSSRMADIEPPKPKTIVVTTQTVFGHQELHPKQFADMRPGQIAICEVKDTGAGESARAVWVSLLPPDAAGDLFGERFRSAVASESTPTTAAATAGSSPPTPPTASPTPPAAPAQPSPTEAPATPQDRGGLPVPLLAGAAVVVLLIAGGVVYAVTFRKRKQSL